MPAEATKVDRAPLVVSRHYVTFCSPGTFVSETTTKPVEAWDVDAAVAEARSVNERHGATPYGFYFTTRGRSADELDAKEVARSPFYWLGGQIFTREEIEARNDPKEEVLRSNMRVNGIARVIVNDNSWRFTSPLGETDVVLPFAKAEA